MQRLLAIIDTNIVVAGVITGDANSPTARILDAMLAGDFLYLMSEQLLNEYASVLSRPKLMQHHGLSEEEIDSLLSELVANAIWREPSAPVRAPVRGDNHLWALLASEPESILVTGDALLIENPPREHSVISARGFVELHLTAATK